jgi:hypothetical protein
LLANGYHRGVAKFALGRQLDRELGEVAQSEAIVRADARAGLLMGRLRELGLAGSMVATPRAHA